MIERSLKISTTFINSLAIRDACKDDRVSDLKGCCLFSSAYVLNDRKIKTKNSLFSALIRRSQ